MHGTLEAPHGTHNIMQLSLFGGCNLTMSVNFYIAFKEADTYILCTCTLKPLISASTGLPPAGSFHSYRNCFFVILYFNFCCSCS